MSILVTNTVYVYFDHLFFEGEGLKLESFGDQTENMTFNVFYSTFTNVVFLGTFFYVF